MGLLSGLTDFVGLTDSGAGDRASAVQQRSADQANALLRENKAEAQGRYKNYEEAGDNAFQSLAGMANGMQSFQDSEGRFQGHDGVFTQDDFKKDDGYQFRMDEGLKAQNAGLSASGLLGSGRAMKALAKYGQNFASNEFQNARNNFNQDYSNSQNNYNNNFDRKFNSMNNIANYGANAKNAITGAGNSATNAINSNIIGMGNANANNELHRNDGMKDIMSMVASGAGAYMGAKK